MTDDTDDLDDTAGTHKSLVERLKAKDSGELWEKRISFAMDGSRRFQCDPDLRVHIDSWREIITTTESDADKAYWSLREAALGVDELICHERVGGVVGQSNENRWDHAQRIDFHRWSDALEVDALVDAVLEQLLNTEAAHRRNRKKIKTNLRIVLLNLYHHFFTLNGAYTAYPRRTKEFNASRYNSLGVSYRSFTAVVDGLLELGLIGNKLGFQKSKGESRWSRMWPELPLISILREHALAPAVGAEIKDRELVQLKDSDKGLVDYEDSDETNRIREFLRRYNTVIEQALIPVPDEQPDLPRTGSFDPTSVVTYRVFNDSSLDLGGRFYGPWWQHLAKEDRSRILINGNPTIELDYRAQYVHLLFGLEGQNYHEAFSILECRKTAQ